MGWAAGEKRWVLNVGPSFWIVLLGRQWIKAGPNLCDEHLPTSWVVYDHRTPLLDLKLLDTGGT